jgi:membrane protease YdiL (CAAX protease family)
MRTAIKYVLAYFAILNFVAPMCVGAFNSIYNYITNGVFSFVFISGETIIPTQVTACLLMAIYLYAVSAIGVGSTRVKPITAAASFGAWIGAYWLISLLMAFAAEWLPNTMEEAFDNILSGWAGILAIAVLGPIIEELTFRHAVLNALLKKFSPRMAILISAILFGVIHINPAQIIPAFLFGLLFGWMCWRTRSLLPTIVLHVLNNCTSVFLERTHNHVDDITQLVSTTTAIGLTIIAIPLLFFSLRFIEKAEQAC